MFGDVVLVNLGYGNFNMFIWVDFINGEGVDFGFVKLVCGVYYFDFIGVDDFGVKLYGKGYIVGILYRCIG